MKYIPWVCFLLCLACSQTESEPEVSGPNESSSDASSVDDSANDATDSESSIADPAVPTDVDEPDEPENSVVDAPENSEDSAEADPSDPEGQEPLDGFGVISGACGVLNAVTRQQIEPLFVQNAIDFAQDPYDESDLEFLTEGGQEIIADGNAGGSSLLSEVFAFEILARCEAALLLKTETEILYEDPAGKKTDLLVMVGESKLGISVTRAVGFPREDPYTVERAQDLLEQKLGGVVSSSANVSEEDAWSKQILYIVAYADEHALSLETAYALLSDEIRSNTLVWVTVSHGDDEFLY